MTDGDRGPAMTSLGMNKRLATLGVTKWQSRPHVSYDNLVAESRFKTL